MAKPEPAPEPVTEPKWEYRMERLTSIRPANVEQLNLLGEQGWEVVGYTGRTALLKRRIV